jgi:hypothetical protein
MNFLPFILFVIGVSFCIYTQCQSNKDLKNFGKIVSVIGFLIVAVIMISDFGNRGIKKGSKYLDNRSNAKRHCSNTGAVLNAKTSYAAKKAYESCVSNY